MDKPDSNGKDGAHMAGKMQLVLEYDCLSFQVTICGDVMPLSLAQMICDEGARVLAEQRRLAAAQQLSAAMHKAAADRVMLDAVRHRR
jgi:hypothetical protein